MGVPSLALENFVINRVMPAAILLGGFLTLAGGSRGFLAAAALLWCIRWTLRN